MLSLQTTQVIITTATIDNQHSIHYGNLMFNYVSTDVSSIGCMALTDRPGKALFLLKYIDETIVILTSVVNF